jgi:DNA repair protein RecO (recombination protein O)
VTARAGRPGGPPARRVWLAPAYVLHQYAYRDTSRIVEVFTSDYGRLTLFARGANGPKSTLRGVLRPFQRMLVSWSGKGEACQLVTAEIDGRSPLLRRTGS